MNNIWNSFEFSCWISGFSYFEYLSYFMSGEKKYTPLDNIAYNELCKLFNDQYERDYDS